MLRALRQQVQEALYAVPADRKPALRRADASDALLATDLLLIADPDAARTFAAAMEAQNWRVREHNGWLLLDRNVPVPEYRIPTELAGECGCCISLLLRHPEDAQADLLIRSVVKAADAGRQPFERLCNQLHGEFSSRLRQHQPLPGVLLPYLCCAYAALCE